MNTVKEFYISFEKLLKYVYDNLKIFHMFYISIFPRFPFDSLLKPLKSCTLKARKIMVISCQREFVGKYILILLGSQIVKRELGDLSITLLVNGRTLFRIWNPFRCFEFVCTTWIHYWECWITTICKILKLIRLSVTNG